MSNQSAPAASPVNTRSSAPVDLTRFAWLSIAAAVATIALKTFAWRITGSVGLLSDAAESVVNLVAAVVALIALRVAIKPPDKDHNFGHSKAEYFSAAVEGAMIFVAAGVIMVSAVQRFLHPQPLENVGVGLLVSVVASVLNGSVAWVLLRAGKQYRSMTLTADGKHLMTDVWTSAGVVAGVGLVWLTNWPRLDSIVAFAVGVNILFTGGKLMHESGMGLMDVSLPKEDNRRIREILESFTGENIMFHGVRTRESGHRRFMDMHLLVPGAWSVQQAHDLVEDITDALLEAYPDLHVMIHSEPIEDPRSYDDYDFGIS
ncbi:cation diffusion facilitator family transporter [Luteococcus japonicus]|uniref:Cation diffusion facilitator family transporter n=1 Tax=Luteococcus japonicus TaxID=33984 RepID=A0A3N1ZTF2_9ACTN|nr:cation diffusion facilitator family transporter [Luteococcus japonicus]ROR54140.1 cation diffusion facilitator family transporter [Luteococcus japonicus]